MPADNNAGILEDRQARPARVAVSAYTDAASSAGAHHGDVDYVVIAGRLGQPPDLLLGSNRPFRRSLDLEGVPVSIRMESWLAADTIRRMGFGHVMRTAYASNIFAPQPRYLVIK